MEEYLEQDRPAAVSDAEHQEVVLDAWQMIVADFDAEISDGKETFGWKATQQSAQEEYAIYVMGALSAGSTLNTLGFWKVRKIFTNSL
jgi:hypothetical protein